MKKVVLFDLDGTLLDSIDDITDGLNVALAPYGRKYASSEVLYMIGDGASKLVERALTGIAVEKHQIKEITARYLDAYQACCLNRSKPYPHVLETLQVLKQKFRIGIITNKPHHESVIILDHFFPKVFEYVWAVHSDLKKPDPQVLEEALAYFQCKKEEVFYVGDSRVDCEFSIRTGIDYAVMTYGFETKENLSNYQPKHLLDDMRDLISLL